MAPKAPPKMTALTTMLNPLDNEKLLMYFTNTNLTLGLQHRPVGKKPTRTMGYDDLTPAAPIPYLFSPSTLASFISEGSVCVYGVVEDATVKKLAMISPVYELLVEDDVTSGNIGGCTDPTEGWLYYHGLDNGDPAIFEKKIAENAGGASAMQLSSYYSETKLSALQEGQNRWLIFQLPDKSINFYHCQNKADYKIPKSSKYAREQTYIAACVVPAKGTREARIYVYYTDSEKHLFRVWVAAGESLQFKSAEHKQVGSGQSTIHVVSQIDVTYNPGNDKNLVHVVEGNSKIISVVEDDLSVD